MTKISGFNTIEEAMNFLRNVKNSINKTMYAEYDEDVGCYKLLNNSTIKSKTIAYVDNLDTAEYIICN